MLTEDGYDLQFGTNVLGHFYFTELVLPTLLSTATSAPDDIARVVNVSSNAHWLSGLDYDTMKDGPARRNARPLSLYGQSKTVNIVFAAEWTRQHSDQGIVSTCLNPVFQWLVPFLVHDVPYGPITQLYAGTTTNGKSLNGKYLIPWAPIGQPRTDTQDPQVGKTLWAYLEEQVMDV